MSSHLDSGPPVGPSLRDLAALRSHPVPLPGWSDLYRRAARISGIEAGADVLDAGWGVLEPLELLAREYGARVTGVHGDASRVELLTARLDSVGMAPSIQVQEASTDGLPYHDGVFQTVIASDLGGVGTGPSGLATRVAELVRVVRPGGSIVLCPWVWRAPLTEEERRALSDHLGLAPRAAPEWQQALEAAGLQVVSSEPWEGLGLSPADDGAPLPTLSGFFPFRERLSLLRRALLRWGGDGVRSLLARDRQVRDILDRSAGVGVQILRGIRPAAADVEPGLHDPERDLTLFRGRQGDGRPKPPPPPSSSARPAAPEVASVPDSVQDLPLFQSEGAAS